MVDTEFVMKRFRPDTIKQYSARVAPYLFLLLRVDTLPILLFTTVFGRRGLSAEPTNICFFEQTRHLGYETKDGTSAVSSEQGKQIN